MQEMWHRDSLRNSNRAKRLFEFSLFGGSSEVKRNLQKTQQIEETSSAPIEKKEFRSFEDKFFTRLDVTL